MAYSLAVTLLIVKYFIDCLFYRCFTKGWFIYRCDKFATTEFTP